MKTNLSLQSNEWSSTTAERLRKLRTAQGLSHQKLSDNIKKKCGVSISPDSLSNYEVTHTEHHSRSNKTKGMKIDFLRALADYYGVSTDYLLCISDIPSNNPSMKSAIEFTGLSQSAIEMIKTLQQDDNASIRSKILDCLLAYPDFTLILIKQLHSYLICNEVYNVAKKKREGDVDKLYKLTHGDIIKEIQLRESGEIEIPLSKNDIEEYQMQKDIAELRVSRQFNYIKDLLEKHFADIRLCAHYEWEDDL